MGAPINVDLGFRSHRSDMREAISRAFPHRESYLGFTLGLVGTVVIVLSLLGWWLVHSGVIEVWSYPQSGVLNIQLRWR